MRLTMLSYYFNLTASLESRIQRSEIGRGMSAFRFQLSTPPFASSASSARNPGFKCPRAKVAKIAKTSGWLRTGLRRV